MVFLSNICEVLLSDLPLTFGSFDEGLRKEEQQQMLDLLLCVVIGAKVHKVLIWRILLSFFREDWAEKDEKELLQLYLQHDIWPPH